MIREQESDTRESLAALQNAQCFQDSIGIKLPDAMWVPDELCAAALDDPHRGVVIVDKNLTCVYMTRIARELLGLPVELLVEGIEAGQLFALGSLDELSSRSAEFALAQAIESHSSSAIILRGAGSKDEIHLSVRNAGPSHAIATFEAGGFGGDVQRARSYEVADPLTGLASRRSFDQAVSAALQRPDAGNIGLMLLDLDRFKPVNDTLGHSAGDAVLRLVAERLTSAVRERDLVARLGGDEFAILIDPADSKNAVASIAQRVLEVVRRTYLIEGQLVNIGTSIGIAIAPEQGASRDTLLRNADLALYDVKDSGRGDFRFFDVTMDARAQARRTSELELRRALSLRQFEVYYQPQVDISQNRIVGFEALVRWNHPEKGVIAPGDFLPVAEEIGIIGPLGDWVLRTACRQAMKWQGELTIAVNASPSQFVTGRFGDTVRRVLAATGLPGARLEIEITEGLLLRTEQVVFQTLDELRAMKVGIAMDDFGTGYASLSQLAQFHFDKIKIDRSLAGNDGNCPKHRAIVRAIAALGDSLGVSTMAEGVEDFDQLQRLRQDGCTAVQGYLISRPVPAQETEKVISRFNP